VNNQAYNPFLPSYEYIPDAEPYVFGDRVYIYGSHDQFDGERYCMNDYVCWSAPVNDLSNWRYEGFIFGKDQDPLNADGKNCLWAPDVAVGADGKFYLYYFYEFEKVIGVAVCDTPAGKFQFYGHVQRKDGIPVGSVPGDIKNFDPGILVDDDGRIFLYSGFGIPYPDSTPFLPERVKGHLGGYVMELENDMITLKSEPRLLFPKKGLPSTVGYEGHEFFEASSIRKVNGTYYFIYSSVNGHELCYATSKYPDRDFSFGGTIISNGDIYYQGRKPQEMLNYPANNHGSIVEIAGKWYVFYHRHTNKHQFSRQDCAEPIIFEENGGIPQVEMTSCGLNGQPLRGIGKYDARIACNLWSKKGAKMTFFFKATLKGHPYFTQSGLDREDHPDQYIAELRNGGTCGFKYFSFEDTTKIGVTVRGTGKGVVVVKDNIDGKVVAEIPVSAHKDWQSFSSTIEIGKGKKPLYFTFFGKGFLDFQEFELRK